MNTNKKVTLIFVLLLIGSTVMRAQDVEKIIAKHIKAHGGIENWEQIKTLKVSGAFTGFSILSEFTMVKKRPYLYRNDYGLGKFDVIEVYNGKGGWTIDPWFDVSFPREINTHEKNVIQQKAEFCTPFFNYKEQGHKVEFLGKEKADGIEVFKIKLTRNDGNVETWYLNTKTYLEFKQESLWADFGSPQMQETFFDDFRKVENITIPFYIDRSYGIRNRIYEINEVVINPTIADDIFTMPKTKEMEKLKTLEGNWSVIIEALSRRGWRRADSISTQIAYYKNTNLLQANLAYESYFKYNNLLTWSFNSESGNYQMTVFNGFSSDNSVLEGSFNNDTLAFDNTKITNESIGTDSKTYQKYILSSISDNSFLIEVAMSRDKGKTWRIREKFIFKRVE